MTASATRLPQRRRLEAFGANGYPAGAGRYVLDGDLEPHSHDYLEIAVLIAGSTIHQRDGERIALTPGSVIAVRPGQWHGYLDCASADVFNLYLGPELLRRELLWTLDHPDLARFLLRGGRTIQPLTTATLTNLVGWLSELAGRTTAPQSPTAAVMLGLLCCALGEIATATFETGSRGSISLAVRRTLMVLADEPAQPWTMAELADRVGISIPHLHRTFTAQVGTSPMAWLAKSRVELAASLLIQDNHPVAEIAHRVGWPDPNYFSRRFREITGASPTAYRLRFRV